MSKQHQSNLLSKDPKNDTKILWRIAWPAVFLNTLQISNSLLDTKFVSGLPDAALTAVGASGSIIFLMFSIAISIAVAASALVSRAYGAGDIQGYKTAARQVFNFGILVSIVSLVLLYFIKPFLISRFIPASDHLAATYMNTYLEIVLYSIPAWMIIESVAGSMMGIGDSKSPMVISGFQVILHMIFNFYLIPNSIDLGYAGLGKFHCMGWGITGAGIAFSASQWIAAISYTIWASRTPLGNIASFTPPTLEWSKRILNISGPSSITWFLRVGMYMILMDMLSNLPNGSIAIAGSRAGFNLESICFMPAFGLSQAAGALVGQSLGMNDTKRAVRLGWLAGHYSAIITGIAAAILYIYVPDIAAWLVNEKQAIMDEAITVLRLMCFSEIFFGYTLTLTGALQGAGDTKSPLWITILTFWIIRIPLLYLTMFTLNMGSYGAWLVMTITQGLSGIITIYVFWKGDWKTKEV